LIDLAALVAAETGEGLKTDSAGITKHTFPTLRVGATRKLAPRQLNYMYLVGRLLLRALVHEI